MHTAVRVTDRRTIKQGQIISSVKDKKKINGNRLNMPAFNTVSCTAASSSDQQITINFRVAASTTKVNETCHGKTV